MAKRERINSKRVNFYDGHRVTEKDLDTEQINNNALASNLVIDFHGSGIVRESPFDQKILLDTRTPGKYAENPSETDFVSGNYDGKPIYLDLQPSDVTYGNRLELELIDSEVMGKLRTKVMIIGRVFDGANTQGELVAEFIEFYGNEKRVTSKFYTSVISIIFNNFSGGSGKTLVDPAVDSLKLIGDSGYMIIREAPQMSVYPATRTSYQIESPNYDMNNFISSDPSRSILYEIELALGAENNINDMYIELDGKEKLKFEKLGATSISYGQKFLATTNNLQKVDLLFSVERDETLPFAEQLDFSGNIVVGIHQLASNISSPTDAVPNDLIDFDPEITPLVEISFSQDDLETLGYKLSEDPQIISFNFAGTLIADPNIDPSIDKGKYYAILVSRRGDNRTGTIVLEKGYDKVTKKSEDGTPQTTLEQFGKQHTKYMEYDPVTKRFINDSTSSLWFQIHTDAVEVTDGTAYTDYGVAVTIPKIASFVGNTQISYFEKDITLRTVSQGVPNYLVLSQKEVFSEPGVHPRTNNFVFTRISDGPSISVVNQGELDDISTDTTPMILAKIEDNNTRAASTISGSFDKPGLIGIDTVRFIDPGQDILLENLINRVIVPDTGCSCAAMYRVVKVECSIHKAADLNSDTRITANDLSLMMPIVGNTINSVATEKRFFNGDIDIVDFVKSDLNNDGTVDGIDIEIMEDAIDGYINFSTLEEFRVITLKLENLLSQSDYPLIFEDTTSSGAVVAAGNTLSFQTSTTGVENEALIIRAGDKISIPSPDPNAGEYLVLTKTYEVVGAIVTVTLTLNSLDGDAAELVVSSGFNVIVTSGSRVNLYADNKALVNTPFSAFNYEINFIESPFQDSFINICDLKRYVGTSFIEEQDNSCKCEEPVCTPTIDCTPVYKNQTYVPGDLYLPSGNILTAPGTPHPGDYEYTNIKVPLPPGSITGCSVDLYNTFVKAKAGTCLTAAGYQAMRYSDGSLVGCEDVGLDTDIAKGRVKFSSSVSGVCVDALIDGYITDGYLDGYIGNYVPAPTYVESSATSVEVIGERYKDFSYSAFNTWDLDPSNSAIFTITKPVGPNSPATIDLTTTTDSTLKFGRINAPSIMSNLEDDFIIDFKMSRDAWPTDPTNLIPSTLTDGIISSFATLTITNADTTVSVLKLGWKMRAGFKTKLFYSGSVKDGISEFNYDIDAPDDLLDAVYFRLRRIDDVVYAYYIIPSKLAEVTAGSFGQYVRIGDNPDVQPGDGTVNMSIEMTQDNSPNAGEFASVRIYEVIARSSHFVSNTDTSYLLRRVDSTKLTNRVTFTVPFELTRRTTVTSATLILNPTSATSLPDAADNINIIPFTLINADNLGKIFNIPTEDDPSYMVTKNLSGVTVGSPINIDITSVYNAILQTQGHLPGFLKGFVIEPDGASEFNFEISSTITLEVTYIDSSTGIIFKIGVDLDASTGIATLNTKNILYDAMNKANRTVLNFGVYLKKSGFKNSDIEISIDDLTRLGIGTCSDTAELPSEEECYFITGNTEIGTFVEGPFPCPL